MDVSNLHCACTNHDVWGLKQGYSALPMVLYNCLVYVCIFNRWESQKQNHLFLCSFIYECTQTAQIHINDFTMY